MKEKLESVFYVYQLRDPREKLPFYIGKGKGSRAWDHFRLAIYDPNYIKKSIIKKLALENITPLVELIKENLSEIEAYDLEAEYIRTYGRISNNTGFLSNLADGGKWGCKRIKVDYKENQISDFNKNFWGDSVPLDIEINIVKSKKSEYMKNFCKDSPPWRSRRSTDETIFIWGKADLINLLKNEFNEIIIKILSLPENSSARITRVKSKLSKGWNPLEDSKWLEDFTPNTADNLIIPSVKKDKTEMYLLGLYNDPPWKSFRANASTLQAWSLADKIFLNPEIGGKKLRTLLNLPKNCSGVLNNIKFKWINKGWNPLKDPQWIKDFRENPDSTNT